MLNSNNVGWIGSVFKNGDPYEATRQWSAKCMRTVAQTNFCDIILLGAIDQQYVHTSLS